jgi:hypothetical protein
MHTIRRLGFKHGSDTGEKVNANAVVWGLDSSELDCRMSCTIDPVPTGEFGNGQKRTPEILCPIVKRFGRLCGDGAQPRVRLHGLHLYGSIDAVSATDSVSYGQDKDTLMT